MSSLPEQRMTKEGSMEQGQGHVGQGFEVLDTQAETGIVKSKVVRVKTCRLSEIDVSIDQRPETEWKYVSTNLWRASS
jgi:hypothetical protein